MGWIYHNSPWSLTNGTGDLTRNMFVSFSVLCTAAGKKVPIFCREAKLDAADCRIGVSNVSLRARRERKVSIITEELWFRFYHHPMGLRNSERTWTCDDM